MPAPSAAPIGIPVAVRWDDESSLFSASGGGSVEPDGAVG